MNPSELAARCHEVQVGIHKREVPDFDFLPDIGMAMRMALHIRGLPAIKFEILRMVSTHFLNIPTSAVRGIVELLGEVEYVRIDQEGKTIKKVIPAIPYFKDLYEGIGEYARAENRFNEIENLTIELIRRLAASPEKLDSLRSSLGPDEALFKRVISIGEECSFIRKRRSRGRDILISPAYFSENPELFVDLAASGNAPGIKKLMDALREFQGIPLSVALKEKAIGNVSLDSDDRKLLVRLAQDGVVKPPTITAEHSGENHFLFTPAPPEGALPIEKRDIFEKCMAVVAAVRQGQLLSQHHKIRSPVAIVSTLLSDKKLRSTTEAAHQYKNLVHLRVGRLVNTGGSWNQFQIIDTSENMEALQMAYSLISSGKIRDMEVNEEARHALQQEQEYIESIVGSSRLAERQKVSISEEQQMELDLLMSK